MNIKCETDMWRNLERYTPEKLWNHMMYTGTEGKVDLYKHEDTRTYVNIDDRGNFYHRKGDGYAMVSKRDALAYVMKFEKEMSR